MSRHTTSDRMILCRPCAKRLLPDTAPWLGYRSAGVHYRCCACGAVPGELPNGDVAPFKSHDHIDPKHLLCQRKDV